MCSLCSVFIGNCQFTVSTDPPSGGIVGVFPDAQNVTLTCQVRNQDGTRRATTWWKQTSQDRKDGWEHRPIVVGGDKNFILFGETITTTVGNFSDTSILTIVSLTDLNTAIIFCGFNEPVANFTLRLYCETIV